MSRFNEPRKFRDCKYDLELYSVVELKDGRFAIVTDYGIYDNQYWCEVCYPEGVNLGAADHFFFNNPNAYRSDILGVVNSHKKIKFVIEEYITALKEYPELYSRHIEFMKSLIKKTA